MSQVNVTINGRQFRMACEDGQEGHLQQLARELDERIVALRGQFGEIGDARLTVMAALMVADELAEAGKKLRRLEADMPRCRTPAAPSAERAQATQAAIVAAVQFGGRADRGHRQEAQPDRRRATAPSRRADSCRVVRGMAGSGRRIRTTLPGRGCGVRQRHIPRGLTILEGSCPWPGPWVRSYGAHLLM